MNVAVIGASDRPGKYGYMAVAMLKEAGHRVFPVHPRLKVIEGDPVYSSVNDISDPLHTVTLYVSHEVSTRIANDLLQKAPKRIIFNPGAENPKLEAQAKQKGIQTLAACTLTLIRTHQFD